MLCTWNGCSQCVTGHLQGAMIKDIREISRERLERTFMTNIVGMITIIQVSHMGMP